MTRYSGYMLSGVRIYSSDAVWRHILTDLNASVADSPGPGYLNFDSLSVSYPVTPMQLKSMILDAIDYSDVLCRVFGHRVTISRMQAQIVALLEQSGGMSISQIKNALGFSPDIATHTIDNAIYQLRKSYGHDFIQNNNGVYTIGKL